METTPADLRAQRKSTRWVAFKVKGALILSFFALMATSNWLRPPPLSGHPAAVAGAGGRVLMMQPGEGEGEGEGEGDLCDARIHTAADMCAHVRAHCADAEGALDYFGWHYCALAGWEGTSVASLIGVVLVTFYLLGETAEEYFCPAVRKLTVDLSLAPSTAGVTFLALGNGAPDVFASLAAFVSGDGKIGLGAIISAGAFVSGFVVGSVAVAAAPFEVDRGPYLRDVLFYLVSAMGVFSVCYGGEVRVEQAAGFVGFYVVYVVVVVVQDRITAATDPARSPASSRASTPPGPRALDAALTATVDAGAAAKLAAHANGGSNSRLGLGEWAAMGVSKARAWVVAVRAGSALDAARVVAVAPFDVLRRATVPAVEEAEWDVWWTVTSVAVAPLFLLWNCRELVAMGTPLLPALAGTWLPLWAVAAAVGAVLGVAMLRTASSAVAPKNPWVHFGLLGLAFVTSIVWISMCATELLGCLGALGIIMGISPTILGVTVLAWGNSVGDLVADVIIARGGQPKMAVAGCYAGPMFNMLMGLGLALTIKTVQQYPQSYQLHYHPNVPISFGFLFASLVGSLTAVSLSHFRITRPWGVCLILLYLVFMVVSLLVETNVIKLEY